MSHRLLSEAIFSRTGIAAVQGEDLLLSYVTGDVERAPHHHDLGHRVLLLEAAGQNLVQRSEEFSNAYWTKTAGSISADATSAPDDETTADKFVESATSAVHMLQRVVTLTNSTTYCWSAFLKAAERNWVRLSILNKANSEKGAWFNLSTGAKGMIDSGVSAYIVRAGNGFYRCAISTSASTGGTSPEVRLALATADGGGSYSGDGSSGAYAWGAQLEQLAFPSSYIETVAAESNRNQEILRWSNNTIPQCMTVYLCFVELGTTQVTSARLFHFGETDDDDPSLVVDHTGGTYRVVHTNGSGVSSSVGTANWGQVVELRAVLYPDGSVQMFTSVDGGAESNGSRSSVKALAASWGDNPFIVLGSAGTTKIGYTGFRSVKIAPGVQTRAFMRSY